MINRVVLVGRLTHDPELKYTPSGIALLRFSLAVDRNYKNAMGEREADFFRIVVWRKLAELCAEYLSKGRMVGVDGKLQSRTYQTPEGEKRTIVEIQADDVRFLGGRSETDVDTSSKPAPPARESGSQDKVPPADHIDQELEEEINLDLDDKIPF